MSVTGAKRTHAVALSDAGDALNASGASTRSATQYTPAFSSESGRSNELSPLLTASVAAPATSVPGCPFRSRYRAMRRLPEALGNAPSACTVSAGMVTWNATTELGANVAVPGNGGAGKP